MTTLTRGKRIDRFMRYVEQDIGGCWIWQGGAQSKGYASFSVGGSKSTLAHRWAFENIGTGKHHPTKISKGKVLGKKDCVNRLCVHPEHWALGSHSYNARKTHCKNGHELAGKNLTAKPDGRRQCRECNNALNRAYYAKTYVPGSKYGDMQAPQSSIDNAAARLRIEEASLRHRIRLRSTSRTVETEYVTASGQRVFPSK